LRKRRPGWKAADNFEQTGDTSRALNNKRSLRFCTGKHGLKHFRHIGSGMISPPLYGFASRCRASCASDKALQQHENKKSFKADPSTLVFSRIICSQVCIRITARQVQTLGLSPTYHIMNTHTRRTMHVAM
jgi:hypothetical protein